MTTFRLTAPVSIIDKGASMASQTRTAAGPPSLTGNLGVPTTPGARFPGRPGTPPAMPAHSEWRPGPEYPGLKPAQAEKTLAAACGDVVHAAANSYLLRDFSADRARVTVFLWHTDQGQLLKDLSHHRFAKLPKAQAIAKINAAPDRADWAEHLKVLADGIPVGR
jgi:hypothetical protein